MIMSSDFGNELNILQPQLNGGTTQPEPSYNGYNMDDVLKDMDMLQNLTFEGATNGEEKDTVVVENNSEATILITRDVPVNKTFENGNGTFDLIGDEGGTCGQTMNIGGNGTILEEENEEQNSTFNLTKLVKVNSEEKEKVDQPPATTVVEEDEVHLDFGRDNGEK